MREANDPRELRIRDLMHNPEMQGPKMITLHRLTGEEFMLGVEHIESIDFQPDTRITLVNGKQLYVQETPSEIRRAMVVWYRLLRQPLKSEVSSSGGLINGYRNSRRSINGFYPGAHGNRSGKPVLFY